jgi:hypothetical protein
MLAAVPEDGARDVQLDPAIAPVFDHLCPRIGALEALAQRIHPRRVIDRAPVVGIDQAQVPQISQP